MYLLDDATSVPSTSESECCCCNGDNADGLCRLINSLQTVHSLVDNARRRRHIGRTMDRDSAPHMRRIAVLILIFTRAKCELCPKLFATARRSSQRVVHLARQKTVVERDKLDRRRPSKLTILATVESTASLLHGSTFRLSAARHRRLSSSATAYDNCLNAKAAWHSADTHYDGKHRAFQQTEWNRNLNGLSFTTRRYVSAVFAVVICVCHKPVLYRNDWTDQAGFWHEGFLPSIIY